MMWYHQNVSSETESAENTKFLIFEKKTVGPAHTTRSLHLNRSSHFPKRSFHQCSTQEQLFFNY